MKATKTQTVNDRKEDITVIPDPQFEPDEPVKVAGRRGHFVFKARRRNLKTGQEWLDLFGGLPTRPGAWHSFPPEAVTAVRRKKSRR